MLMSTLEINLELVNGQVQVTTLTSLPSGINLGDSLQLEVSAGSGLGSPTIQTLQFFLTDGNGQPGVMEAIWARIGQTDGIFTTSGLVFAAMQPSNDPSTVTFININVSDQCQDAFFICSGFVSEGTATHSWVLDPEVILRSGEWMGGQ